MARRGLQGECGYCILYDWPNRCKRHAGGVSKMIYMLWKFILLGRRAFSQPEGLFEWDIDAFIIQCQLMNYHLKLKKICTRPQKIVHVSGKVSNTILWQY